MGSIGLSNYRGIVSPSYIIIKSIRDFIPEYYHHLFRSNLLIQNFEKLSYGVRIGQWDLRFEDFKDISILYPPLIEQLQIVSFLDQKTSLIDTLIEKKLRKIELLKEQRTSIINHTVTKGLNPTVKMKDSGVEWIGDVPEHWVLLSLKYIIQFNQESLPETTPKDYKLMYIEISDVNERGEVINTTEYSFGECPSRCRRIVYKGDVFISTVRTYLRSIGFIKEDVENLICSTGFCVLSPKEQVYSNFLYFYVITECFITEVITQSFGVSYPSITSNDLVNIKVLLPSIAEQYKIVEFLDKKTSEIDTQIQLENKKIVLLKEYRQSLISEVVSGKIDVRKN